MGTKESIAKMKLIRNGMRIHRNSFDLDSYKIRRNESFGSVGRRRKSIEYKSKTATTTAHKVRFMFIVATHIHACMSLITHGVLLFLVLSVLGVFVCVCVRIRIFFLHHHHLLLL